MKNSPSLVNKRHCVGYIILLGFLGGCAIAAMGQSVSWQLPGDPSFGLVFTHATGTFSSAIKATGDHSLVSVACSGDCAVVSDSFADGSSLSNGQVTGVSFLCDSAVAGNFSSVFTVSSAEDAEGDSFGLSCVVLDVNKPLAVGPAGIWGAMQVSAVHSPKFSAAVFGFSDGMQIMRTYSEDGGVSWKAPVVLFSDPELFESHPSVFLAPDGNEWVFYARAGGVEYRSSADWSVALVVDSNRVNAKSPMAKVWDTGETTWLVFEGQGKNVYLNSATGLASGGLDWSGDKNLARGSEPALDVNQDSGDVFVVFVAPDTRLGLLSRNNISGNWSEISFPADHVGRHPSVGIAPSGIFLAFERDGGIFVIKSLDGGSSWSAEELVAQNGRGPHVSVNSDGKVWLSFDQNGSALFGFVD